MIRLRAVLTASGLAAAVAFYGLVAVGDVGGYRGGYPEIDYGLFFSHRVHLEGVQGTRCLTCHKAVPTSTSCADDLIPLEETCLECHKDQRGEGKCGFCHMNAAHPVEAERAPVHPEFSHEAHLGRGAQCGQCHPGVRGAALAGAEMLPGMETCWKCHDGSRSPSDCALCHAGIKDLRPPSHLGAFTHTHQFAARGRPESCEMCHGQSASCSECHAGENILPEAHERSFLYTHPLDLGQRVSECASCHRLDSFCSDCHQERGIRSAEHSLQEWAFGPPYLHAQRARADIGFCTSCHETDTPKCVECHSDPDEVRGTQAQFDIHTSGFGSDEEYGPWHDDPGYFCYDCHANAVKRAGVGFCGYCHGAEE